MSRLGISPLFSASRKESQMKMQSSTLPRRRRVVSAASAILVLAAALVFQAITPSAVHAANSLLKVNVVSARTEGAVNAGSPITDFKYIINLDNTGTTGQRSPAPGTGCSTIDPGYPDSCRWPSISNRSGKRS